MFNGGFANVLRALQTLTTDDTDLIVVREGMVDDLGVIHDLTSVTGLFGSSWTFARIKLLWVRNTHAINTLLIQAGGTGAGDGDLLRHTSDRIKIRPGGLFVWTSAPNRAGSWWTVGGDKTELRLFPESGQSVTYQYAISGVAF